MLRGELGRVYFFSIQDIKDISFKFIATMPTGKIARIMDRGYGFIAREGEEKDLFFHSNDLQGIEFNDLKEGDEVTFEVAQGRKGPAAVNVSRA